MYVCLVNGIKNISSRIFIHIHELENTLKYTLCSFTNIHHLIYTYKNTASHLAKRYFQQFYMYIYFFESGFKNSNLFLSDFFRWICASSGCLLQKIIMLFCLSQITFSSTYLNISSVAQAIITKALVSFSSLWIHSISCCISSFTYSSATKFYLHDYGML